MGDMDLSDAGHVRAHFRATLKLMSRIVPWEQVKAWALGEPDSLPPRSNVGELEKNNPRMFPDTIRRKKHHRPPRFPPTPRIVQTECFRKGSGKKAPRWDSRIENRDPDLGNRRKKHRPPKRNVHAASSSDFNREFPWIESSARAVQRPPINRAPLFD
jgi:hypothetical protein